MKILVTDMGGVLYSADPGFDPIKHLENFERAKLELGCVTTDFKSQLEAEWLAVEKGTLKIYPIESGISNLKHNLDNCKVVIVSTSLVKTSKFILEKLGIKTNDFDIYDMSDYGSKKDKEAWRKIFEKYDSIDYIVEDGESNLKAANEAARELGFAPKTFTAMPDLGK